MKQQHQSDLETVREESSNASSETIDYLQTHKFDEKNLYFQELNNRGKSGESVLLKPLNLDGKSILDGQERRNSGDVLRIGNTIYGRPFTVVNHIRTSMDDSEIEITVYDNGRHASVASSATFSGKHIWYGVTLFTLIVMTSIIATLMITMKPQMNGNDMPDDDDDDDFNIRENWYVKKSRWMGNSFTTPAPPKTHPHPKSKIKHPAKNVILDETRTTSCENVTDCTVLLREMQEKTLPTGIGYNFLVSHTGLVFEARGPNVTPYFYWPIDDKTLVIGCIGSFSTQNGTQQAIYPMTRAIRNLLKCLVTDHKVWPLFDLIGGKRFFVKKPVRDALNTLTEIAYAGGDE